MTSHSLTVERLFPLRELTEKLARRLRHGVMRTCNSLHECCLCDLPITMGQTYFDAGLKFRSHFEHIVGGCKPDCRCVEG